MSERFDRGRLALKPVLLLAFCALALQSHAAPKDDGSVLPFPPTPSGSKAGRTIALSTYSPVAAPRRLPKDAPNILIIMLDDAGAGLPSTYGGVVHTPTLSRVAEAGVSYNRFHNAAMCSPTRAALLTGRNHHRVGNGQIAELANDWPGYAGVLPRSAATVAKVLGYYGYSTAAFGKWHNTPANETTALGPFTNWPVGPGIGFDYFYGFLAGESSQYEPAVVENTVRIEPAHGRKNYHFTKDMTDKAVSWIRQQRALAPDRPFLMYWAPGGAHGPHHVAKPWADKYKGRFDGGWDALRQTIFDGQKKAGWIPANTQLTPRPATLPAWSDIPADEKAFHVRLMEVFAGYVEHTDTQAGRLLDTLGQLGIRDNTLIFYIWSDNGASAEGQNGTVSELLAQNLIPTKISDHIRTVEGLGGFDVIGTAKTDNMYHAAWAWGTAAPFKATKLVAGFFGGTRTPMAVSWPKSIKPDRTPRSQFHHVNDITPTIYEALGIRPPKIVDGVAQNPLDGVSLMYTFGSAAAAGRKKSQYFEIMASRAYYEDGWIASAFGPRIPWVPGATPGLKEWSPDKDTWELYNLNEDFSQARDLAAAHPQKLEAMKRGFDAAARDNKVYPIGGGLYSQINTASLPSNPATEFFYTQDVTRVPEFVAPRLGAVSNVVTIDTELKPDSAGVLYALGAFSGGVAAWVDKGKLTYEFNCFMVERTQIATSAPLPTGKVKIEVETRYSGDGLVQQGDVVIRINGKEAARGRVPQNAPWAFTLNDAFDVGRDSYSPVSMAYHDRAPFAFNGAIQSVNVRYLK